MRRQLPLGHFAFGGLAAERAPTAQAPGDLPGAQRLIEQAIDIDQQAAQQGKSGAQFLPILLTYRAPSSSTRGSCTPRAPILAGPSRCCRRMRGGMTTRVIPAAPT